MSKNYKHLNREERYSIKEMRDKGISINEISKDLQNIDKNVIKNYMYGTNNLYDLLDIECKKKLNTF